MVSRTRIFADSSQLKSRNKHAKNVRENLSNQVFSCDKTPKYATKHSQPKKRKKK